VISIRYEFVLWLSLNENGLEFNGFRADRKSAMRQQHGFTLLEIVFALSISAILWVIVGDTLLNPKKPQRIQQSASQACVELKVQQQRDCESYQEFVSVIESGGSNYLIELYLRGRKIDINAKDKNGRTPLMIAAMRLDPRKAQSLIWILDAGADPYARDNDGVSALQYLERSDFAGLWQQYKQLRKPASGSENNK
jgi:prepilin-type N-terminal cleavage/methylation domain-containing protein